MAFFEIKMSFDSIVPTANEQWENESLGNSMSREIGASRPEISRTANVIRHAY